MKLTTLVKTRLRNLQEGLSSLVEVAVLFLAVLCLEESEL